MGISWLLKYSADNFYSPVFNSTQPLSIWEASIRMYKETHSGISLYGILSMACAGYDVARV